MDASTRNSLLWGSILTAVGLACVWVFGYQPWHDATLHAEKVTLSFKVLLFTPLFLILGVMMLLPLRPLPPNHGGPLPLRAKVLAACLLIGTGAGIAYYFWLRAFLKAMGYDV